MGLSFWRLLLRWSIAAYLCTEVILGCRLASPRESTAQRFPTERIRQVGPTCAMVSQLRLTDLATAFFNGMPSWYQSQPIDGISLTTHIRNHHGKIMSDEGFEKALAQVPKRVSIYDNLLRLLVQVGYKTGLSKPNLNEEFVAICQKGLTSYIPTTACPTCVNPDLRAWRDTLNWKELDFLDDLEPNKVALKYAKMFSEIYFRGIDDPIAATKKRVIMNEDFENRLKPMHDVLNASALAPKEFGLPQDYEIRKVYFDNKDVAMDVLFALTQLHIPVVALLTQPEGAGHAMVAHDLQSIDGEPFEVILHNSWGDREEYVGINKQKQWRNFSLSGLMADHKTIIAISLLFGLRVDQVLIKPDLLRTDPSVQSFAREYEAILSGLKWVSDHKMINLAPETLKVVNTLSSLYINQSYPRSSRVIMED